MQLESMKLKRLKTTFKRGKFHTEDVAAESESAQPE